MPKKNQKGETNTHWTPSDNIIACCCVLFILTISVVFVFWSNKEKIIQDTVKEAKCLEEFFHNLNGALGPVKIKYLKIKTTKGYEIRVPHCDKIKIGDNIEFHTQNRLFKQEKIYIFSRKLN